MRDGVVALGLGGYEVGRPPEKFDRAFSRARSAELPAVPHAGETVGPAISMPSASATVFAVWKTFNWSPNSGCARHRGGLSEQQRLPQHRPKSGNSSPAAPAPGGIIRDNKLGRSPVI